MIDILYKNVRKFIKGLRSLMKPSSNEKIGFYVCALVDVLGQKEELLKLDEIPSVKEEDEKSTKIFRNAYGRVKQLRQQIIESSAYFNSTSVRCIDSPIIKHTFFSDLIVMYLSLSKDDSQLDICRLKHMLLSLSDVFLEMLSRGIPLRGGIDIGLAIASPDGQLYGRALSKAYDLESNVASSIRIVIGQELYDFLELASQDTDENRSDDAKFCKALITQDTDGVYILDYLSKLFQDLPSFKSLRSEAESFLTTENNKYRRHGNYKVAKKYSDALKYFQKNLSE